MLPLPVCLTSILNLNLILFANYCQRQQTDQPFSQQGSRVQHRHYSVSRHQSATPRQINSNVNKADPQLPDATIVSNNQLTSTVQYKEHFHCTPYNKNKDAQSLIEVVFGGLA